MFLKVQDASNPLGPTRGSPTAIVGHAEMKPVYPTLMGRASGRIITGESWMVEDFLKKRWIADEG